MARCQGVGRWEDRPAATTYCLVFITRGSDVKLASKYMANVPRKHVGIFLNTTIWHYSNARRQVSTQTPDEFRHHYPAPDNDLF